MPATNKRPGRRGQRPHYFERDGWVGGTGNRMQVAEGLSPSGGILYVSLLEKLYAGDVISEIGFFVSAASSGISFLWAVILDENRTKIAQSVPWSGGDPVSGWYWRPLETRIIIPKTESRYYVGLCMDAAFVTATFAKQSVRAATVKTAAFNNTSPILSGTSNTGLGASIPALNPANTFTGNGDMILFGLR